jgi:hypothetical protein
MPNPLMPAIKTARSRRQCRTVVQANGRQRRGKVTADEVPEERKPMVSGSSNCDDKNGDNALTVEERPGRSAISQASPSTATMRIARK